MAKKSYGKVFAKHGTKQKVFIPDELVKSTVEDIQKLLNKKYGGDWILVDWVYPGEILKFSDSTTYYGFNPSFSRYSDSIKKLK